MPTWSGGAFLTVDLPPSSRSPEASASPDPTVFISSNQGNASLQLRIPGAVWTQNRGIARGADGMLAVCGDAKDANGWPWAYLAFFVPNSAQHRKTWRKLDTSELDSKLRLELPMRDNINTNQSFHAK
jgi:hypothetical protein